MTSVVQRITIIGLAALWLSSGMALAQVPTEAPSAARAAAAAGAMAPLEAMRLREQITGIHKKAIADPVVAQMKSDLDRVIKSMLIDMDPVHAEIIDQVERLDEQIGQAKASGDKAQVRKLISEARELDMKLRRAQLKIAEDPNIRKEIDKFEAVLEHKIRLIEPGIDALRSQLRAAGQRTLTPLPSRPPTK